MQRQIRRSSGRIRQKKTPFPVGSASPESPLWTSRPWVYLSLSVLTLHPFLSLSFSISLLSLFLSPYLCSLSFSISLLSLFLHISSLSLSLFLHISANVN